jgi:hypothetical protein
VLVQRIEVDRVRLDPRRKALRNAPEERDHASHGFVRRELLHDLRTHEARGTDHEDGTG